MSKARARANTTIWQPSFSRGLDFFFVCRKLHIFRLGPQKNSSKSVFSSWCADKTRKIIKCSVVFIAFRLHTRKKKSLIFFLDVSFLLIITNNMIYYLKKSFQNNSKSLCSVQVNNLCTFKTIYKIKLVKNIRAI